MTQEALPIDVIVEEAIRRARSSCSAWSSSEAKLALSARRALQGITSLSPTFSTFESISRLLPFAAGMIDVLSISHTSDLANMIYNVPESFLSARARLLEDDPAVPMAARLPAGLALRGPDALGEELFQRSPYIHSMYPHHGLDNMTGMILSSAARGATKDVTVLWLFSGSGIRLPTWRECRLLELVTGDIWEALERMRLPLIPNQHILFQIMQEQDIGYVVLRADGTILEANRRAVLLSQTYGLSKAASWRSRLDEFVSGARTRAQRGSLTGQTIQHPDHTNILELNVHRLSKERYAISEDVTLIQLKERGADRSAAAETRREGPLERLPPRRREVATLLVESGLSYKQIAQRLSMAEGTVRKNAELAYRAFGVHSRAELVELVSRHSGGCRRSG